MEAEGRLSGGRIPTFLGSVTVGKMWGCEAPHSHREECVCVRGGTERSENKDHRTRTFGKHHAELLTQSPSDTLESQ